MLYLDSQRYLIFNDFHVSILDIRCWILDLGSWMLDHGYWMLDVIAKLTVSGTLFIG